MSGGAGVICGFAQSADRPSSKVWQMSYKFIRHFAMKEL